MTAETVQILASINAVCQLVGVSAARMKMHSEAPVVADIDDGLD